METPASLDVKLGVLFGGVLTIRAVLFGVYLSTPPFLETPTSLVRGPKDHINIRILQTMISGIP